MSGLSEQEFRVKSDEALEGAAETKKAANHTLFFCTALDMCPGP